MAWAAAGLCEVEWQTHVSPGQFGDTQCAVEFVGITVTSTCAVVTPTMASPVCNLHYGD